MEKPQLPRFNRFTFLWFLVLFLGIQISNTISIPQGMDWTYILYTGISIVFFVLPGMYLYNKAVKSDVQNGITLRPLRNILLPWPKPAIGLMLFVLFEIAVLVPLYTYIFSPCTDLDLVRKLNGCLKVFPHTNPSIHTMTLSGDGTVLATTGLSDVTQIWSYPEMKLISNLGKKAIFLTGMSLSSDGNLLAICGAKTPIVILDTKTGAVIHNLIPDGKYDCEIVFTPDDKFLISASDAGSQIWDVTTGKLVDVLQEERASQLAISPNGSLLAVANPNGTINVWRMSDRTILRTVVVPYFQDIIISADGKYLITTRWDVFDEPKVEPLNASSTIKVWNISNGNIENTIKLPNSNIEYLAATKNGNGFAASNDSCFGKRGVFGPYCAYYWQTATSTTPFALHAPGTMRSLLFSPTDNRLLSNDYSALYVWQVP